MSFKAIKVKDQTWKVHGLSVAEYEKKFDTDSEAITLSATMEIYFKDDCLTLEAVRHEIFHAYVFGLHLRSADLTMDQFEEVIAEFIGQYLQKLNRQSNAVLKWLKNGNSSKKDTVSESGTQRK